MIDVVGVGVLLGVADQVVVGGAQEDGETGCGSGTGVGSGTRAGSGTGVGSDVTDVGRVAVCAGLCGWSRPVADGSGAET
ncbi:Hypp8145 [Branchiostoma lanceolatum]|uniref:Hypp8145 protein n=1 Tax=Branchiostoma lanceolatum TaxID=7740 RepID=A0A8K0EF01_BRALA|nr:Hypp8145 [Branchiostoma lanceolatum]